MRFAQLSTGPKRSRPICPLREQERTDSWFGCIALGHDGSNDAVDGSKLALVNDLPDAQKQIRAD